MRALTAESKGSVAAVTMLPSRTDMPRARIWALGAAAVSTPASMLIGVVTIALAKLMMRKERI